MTKALWPARYPTDELNRRHSEMGSLAYDKEYLVTPRSDSSSMFPFELFEPNFAELEILRPSFNPQSEGMVVSMGVDLAIGLVGDSDYNVCFTLAMDKHGKRHILNIARARHFKKYTGILEFIKKQADAYQPAFIVPETTSFQVIIEQMMKDPDAAEKYRMPGRIEGHKTGREKIDLADGVPGLRMELENGKYVIPRGNAASRGKTDTWISECAAFGWQDGKLGGIGEHDDTVMAWWFAEIGLTRLSGTSARSGSLAAKGVQRGK